VGLNQPTDFMIDQVLRYESNDALVQWKRDLESRESRKR
jgi:hypothetical protein